MNHLALDLGITTGYAVHNVRSEQLLEHGTIPDSSLEVYLKDLLVRFMPQYTTAEMPVIIRGELGDALHEVVVTTRRVFMHQVEEVEPSQWKTHPIAKTPLPRGRMSAHERDAIRLGLWALATRGILDPKDVA